MGLGMSINCQYCTLLSWRVRPWDHPELLFWLPGFRIFSCHIHSIFGVLKWCASLLSAPSNGSGTRC